MPAAAARSFWKGHLRLALVTIPIRLVSATSSEGEIHFHQVDRKSKQRIRYQKVTADDGRQVQQSDIVKGYEVEPGNYVLLEDEELDALKLDTRHTVELQEFVDPCEIDPLYFDKPYYVLPDGDVAEEGYRVIRDALQATKMCGIGQLTMRGRENLVALTAYGPGLELTTLRYEAEIKDADRVFADIGTAKLKSDLIDMAKKLIAERKTDFEPERYKNHYSEALRELVNSKLKGGGSVAVSGGDEGPPKGTVIDFMEALRASVNGKGKAAAAPSRKTKTAAASARAAHVKRAPAARKKGGKRASR
jgi:DNA end-binding protein Ku